MLLDEPFSALDTHLRESTRDLVGEVLHEAGVTTVLVTHDQEEALAFADLVAVLEAGELRQVGPPQEVYERPNDLATARLLGSTLGRVSQRLGSMGGIVDSCRVLLCSMTLPGPGSSR